MSYRLFIVPFLLGVGLALLITSIATHHWLDLEVEAPVKLKAYGGLFKTCVEDTCITYDDTGYIALGDDIKLVRALVIMPTILYGMGLCLSAYFGKNYKTITSFHYRLVAIVICVVGALLAIAAVARFVALTEESEEVPSVTHEYGYSLHLAWVAALFGIFAGVAAFFVMRPLQGGMDDQWMDQRSPRQFSYDGYPKQQFQNSMPYPYNQGMARTYKSQYGNGGYAQNEMRGYSRYGREGYSRNEMGNSRYEMGGNSRFEMGGNSRYEIGGNSRYEMGGNSRYEMVGNSRYGKGGYPQHERGGYPKYEMGGNPKYGVGYPPAGVYSRPQGLAYPGGF